MASLPRCAGCDKPIRAKGDYKFFDGEDWCLLCYEAVKDMPTTKPVRGKNPQLRVLPGGLAGADRVSSDG